MSPKECAHEWGPPDPGDPLHYARCIHCRAGKPVYEHPRRPAIPMRPTRGISPNEPEEGMWEFRYVKEGPLLPCRISRIDYEPGSENDPDGPNILDTDPIWVANVGKWNADPLLVWTGRRGRALTEAEYELRMAQLAWDLDYDPFAPAQQPRKPVDIGELKPIGPSE